MSEEDYQKLCMDLLHSETEEEVIGLLRDAGYWENGAVWRPYGDLEDNFSIIGNQQSTPEAALVEKVVNSIDAILIDRCLRNGTEPDSEVAPNDMNEAVALYFAGNAAKADSLGHISNWDSARRTQVSRLITVAATRAANTGPTECNPCFTILDAGEGQTPLRFPHTVLSLHHKNKERIRFVQGKFNMGGTGVLQFCGRYNIQLIISRRDPLIVPDGEEDPTSDAWGFTVVRRQDPPVGEKSSLYTYLAPCGADTNANKGEVLRFHADSLPLAPQGSRAYTGPVPFGTLIKLYEYHARGFRSMMFMRDGLLSRLDILLPGIALPIRLHECRNYPGHKGSFETTVSGLTARLGDNRADNLEQGYPTTSHMSVQGEQMDLKIYAFKKGRAETYRKNEGIIFTVNGQTHGHLTTDFFRRTKVGMSRLLDSLLVEVDCSRMTVRAREDLFMNSRDRLRAGELKNAITAELESVIRNHEGLRALREERKRQELAERIGDSRPLEEALSAIIRSSPSLSRLFLHGDRLPNPFNTQRVAAGEGPYVGKTHPTYFKFARIPYGEILERNVAANMRARITFETDVVNEYFSRTQNAGSFQLIILRAGKESQVRDYSMNLHDGKATLSVSLPSDVAVGEKLEYTSHLVDDTLVFPFTNAFVLTVVPPQVVTGGDKRPGKPPSERVGHQREVGERLAIPDVNRVTRDAWTTRQHPFDEFSALEVVQEKAATFEEESGEEAEYSFWVNVDNKFLATEIKASDEDPEVLTARFVFGMVLLGVALLKGEESREHAHVEERMPEEETNGIPIEDQIFEYSKSVAKVLLPMIRTLGALETDSVSLSAGQGDDS
ncbi:MAG: hypothetical protein ACTSYX_02185 [Candidatus Thorarchaeota archaeon]